jgi:alanine or glycine:cation symporter, AGCS family
MIDFIKESITLYIIFPVIVFIGGYLTYRLRFLQLTQLSRAFHMIKGQKKAGGISSFSAVSAILGGNLGTGNISGIAIALATGGPGALFWMWVMAFLASIIKFIGCFLGVEYREKDSAKEWVGGPMYYLTRGLKMPLMGKLFCVFTIFSALTVGNMVQVHSLSLPFKEIGVHPFYLGIGLALLVGGVIMGGLARFASVVSAVVPFMAIIYVGACLSIIFLNYDQVGNAFSMIFQSAMGFGSVAGGALGFTIFQAIRTGFDRGLFATDAGLGLAPIIHAAVTDQHEVLDNKVVQGIISVLSPIIVMVICTMTGLVLLITGVWNSGDLESTNMCVEAFKFGLNSPSAGYIVFITLFFFAFTTILTWSFCADKSIEFLFGRRYIKLFQLFFIAFIFIGGFLQGSFVWLIADISLNLMFIINMIGVVGLSAGVISFTRKQFELL